MAEQVIEFEFRFQRAFRLAALPFGVRPENWRLVSAEEGGLPVTVTVVEELGADSFVYGTCDVEGTLSNVIVRVSGRHHPQKGETLHVTTDPEHVHVFDTETGERLSD